MINCGIRLISFTTFIDHQHIIAVYNQVAVFHEANYPEIIILTRNYYSKSNNVGIFKYNVFSAWNVIVNQFSGLVVSMYAL